MYVVFGAAANTGKRVATLLLEQGHPVTVVGRRREALSTLEQAGAHVAVGDITDSDFTRLVLRDCEGAYALLPYDYGAADLFALQKEQIDSLVNAARVANVKRLVGLSSYGAHLDENSGVMKGLHYFESSLNTIANVATVALRAGFFYNNFIGMAGYAKSQGILGGFPIEADIKMPMVDVEDIAVAAVRFLTDESLSGHQIAGVAGPESLSLKEAADILGQAVGKTLQWVRFTDEDAKTGMIGLGMSASVADAFVEFSRAANAGRVWGNFIRTTENSTPTKLVDFAREAFTEAYTCA